MGSQFEDTIKDKGTTLEEAVAPIPPVVLHDMMRLGFDPKVERDQRNAADPPGQASSCHKITWKMILN